MLSLLQLFQIHRFSYQLQEIGDVIEVGGQGTCGNESKALTEFTPILLHVPMLPRAFPAPDRCVVRKEVVMHKQTYRAPLLLAVDACLAHR